MEYLISQHALEQMEARCISREIVEQVLSAPDQRIEQNNLMIYQGLVGGIQEKRFLVRVFVNFTKTPPMVVSVYRTSKIEKYYEGKI